MRATKLIKGILWRQIRFGDGEISFYKCRVDMMPSSIFADLLTNANDFFEEALYQYEMAKESYLKSFFKALKDKGVKGDKLIKITMNFADLAGWGKPECTSSQIKKGLAIYVFKDSAIASAYVTKYGKSKYPVCHALRGAIAAGAVAVQGSEIEAVETKCLAKGDPYCEFLVKPRKEFLSTKNEDYRKQLGLK